MAPMTSRVADGQQDRLAGGFGFLESFGAPAVPVNGIVLVQEKVGTCFLGEAVAAHLFFPIGARLNAPLRALVALKD